jgi:hypothetical protein
VEAATVTSRRFELYLLKSQKWGVTIPAVVFVLLPTVFVVLYLLGAIPTRELNAGEVGYFPLFPFGLFWVIGLLYVWTILTLPFRITVTPDKRLEFKSLIRTTSIAVQDVKSIEPSYVWFVQIPATVLRLNHATGTIRFIGQFTDQHVLVSELKQESPGVVLLGC